MTRRTTSPRVGFTLIELIVVVTIIAILMALLLPAVQYVRRGAKRAQARTEMEQISAAIGSFKTKFNVQYIPAFGAISTTNTKSSAPFRLCSTYRDPASGAWLNWPEVAYLKQVFPQMESVPAVAATAAAPAIYDNGLRVNGNRILPANAIELDPNQVLIFFLTGGGPYTGYQGFSNNKVQPFTPPTAGESRIPPALDVNATKLTADGHYLDPWGTPYAYFTAIQGNDYGSPTAATPYFPAFNTLNADGTESGPVTPYYSGSGANLKFFNAKSFQIISAGHDKKFGCFSTPPAARTGMPPGFLQAANGPGNWTPKAGDWLDNAGPGADDLSNFNGGPLVEPG